jgi:NADPH2:quinone reductase
MQRIEASHPGGPEVLHLAEAPVPVPKPGEVRVKVAYATLTPLDVFIRQGRIKWLAGDWPFVPGQEFSGRIEAVGPGVDTAWRGKAVLSFSEFGGCAEHACVPVKRLALLDEALGWPVATAWRTPTLAAWYALTAALRLQKGETLLIHSAAGPVGIMATQIAAELGARVIGLAGGPAKIAYAKPFGASTLIDYRLPDWPAQVRAASGGTGVAAILDGNGGSTALRNYEVLAPQGRVLYLGATSGMAAPDVPSSLLVGKSIGVGGFNLNSIPDAAIEADLPRLVERLAKGKWRFPVAQVAELADVPSLHAAFEARQLMGRVVIQISEVR